jgi:hypothetical protein
MLNWRQSPSQVERQVLGLTRLTWPWVIAAMLMMFALQNDVVRYLLPR